jgi:predicted nucleic acid-binding protein
MSFVLDASIALSWCFSDESTPVTISLLEKLETEKAFVPAIWSLEVGNILIGAERKKRISYAKITEFLTLLEDLDIRVDYETHTRAFQQIFSLAHSEKLTTYDAAYLELAMRLGVPLATKDRQLYEAALGLGVRVFSDSEETL